MDDQCKRRQRERKSLNHPETQYRVRIPDAAVTHTHTHTHTLIPKPHQQCQHKESSTSICSRITYALQHLRKRMTCIEEMTQTLNQCYFSKCQSIVNKQVFITAMRSLLLQQMITFFKLISF